MPRKEADMTWTNVKDLSDQPLGNLILRVFGPNGPTVFYVDVVQVNREMGMVLGYREISQLEGGAAGAELVVAFSESHHAWISVARGHCEVTPVKALRELSKADLAERTVVQKEATEIVEKINSGEEYIPPPSSGPPSNLSEEAFNEWFKKNIRGGWGEPSSQG